MTSGCTPPFSILTYCTFYLAYRTCCCFLNALYATDLDGCWVLVVVTGVLPTLESLAVLLLTSIFLAIALPFHYCFWFVLAIGFNCALDLVLGLDFALTKVLLWISWTVVTAFWTGVTLDCLKLDAVCCLKLWLPCGLRVVCTVWLWLSLPLSKP